jgi:hypothetical protein
VAYQNELSRDFPVVNADILDEPYMYGVVEKRMKIEQYVDAWFRDCPNVLQDIGWFRIQELRLEVDIEPLQTIGYGPAE